MRVFSVMKKSIKEQIRDIWVFILTACTAPFFVFLYWLMSSGGSTSYNLLVLNNDINRLVKENYADSLVDEFKKITYNDGKPILSVVSVTNRQEAETKLKNREATAMAIIPAGFSEKIISKNDSANKSGREIIIEGDLTNPYYPVASIMANVALIKFSEKFLNFITPINVNEIALGNSSTRTEFENYVPGLFVLALIMLVYSVAMPIARENESGTIKRLKITYMNSFDYLGGLSLVQIMIAVFSVLCTIFTAKAFGFRSEGSMFLAIIIISITSLSFIGVGLIVACFSRNATEALVIGTFPMFLLMFFTGAALPISKTALFTVFGRTINLQDFLAPTHAVTALNKIFIMGAGFGDILFELSAMLVLSLVYYASGIFLFQKMRLNRN
jgi:ABC-2 type transport system permease protein